MPTLDQCHDQVVNALKNDGWQLDASPSRFLLPYRYVYIDLRLSRKTNGKREQILLVEVKCFIDEKKRVPDLYLSIGQYLVYRALLVESKVMYPLYLAVPENIFGALFDPAVMRVVQESHINIVLINLEKETVTRWIRW